MNFTIEIAKECSLWDQYLILNEDFFSDIARCILSRHSNFSKARHFEISILLTDNNKMHQLNTEFLDKNYPTNVLSFPDLEINPTTIKNFVANNEYLYLGDIAFGYQVIEQESQDKSIRFEDHFTHLVVHAILHLIGYDHIDEQDADIMQQLEIEILKIFNIKSPYC